MTNKLYHSVIILLCICCGCSSSYLDVKPSSNLTVPNSLETFRQLLDHGNVVHVSSEFADIMADDYYMEYTYWQSRGNLVAKNAYIWAEDIYGTTESHPTWDDPYRAVFYANVVLDGTVKLSVSEQQWAAYKAVRGAAFFTRAFAFYKLLQLFAPPYDVRTADTDPGIPLKRSSDVNERITRSSVAASYTQVLADLEEAEELLPPELDYRRPSRPAAQALKARVYLMMGNYPEAAGAATRCLDNHSWLTDFNTANPDYRQVLYFSVTNSNLLLYGVNQNTITVPELYESYAEDDLRKQKYYRLTAQGRPYKTASFGSGIYHFTGLDTDEVILTRAECYARQGRVAEAMADLNHLLKHRHVAGSFEALTANDKDEALEIILWERRKELVCRGVRWSDLRRLNVAGAGISLRREMNGRLYTLPANSTRWVFPIPANEIKLTGITQNER